MGKQFDPEMTERNQLILYMYSEDPNISKIARTFGVSLTRVKQVLDRAGVRKTKQEGSQGQYHSKAWDYTTERIVAKPGPHSL
jgi:hypothetical protein